MVLWFGEAGGGGGEGQRSEIQSRGAVGVGVAFCPRLWEEAELGGLRRLQVPAVGFLLFPRLCLLHLPLLFPVILSYVGCWMGGTGSSGVAESVSRGFGMCGADVSGRWSLSSRWRRDLTCQWLLVFLIGGVKYLWLKNKHESGFTQISQTHKCRVSLNQIFNIILLHGESRGSEMFAAVCR